jgi:hypothetical protein
LQGSKTIPWIVWFYLVFTTDRWKKQTYFFQVMVFTAKQGFPNHSEAFLRGILDYGEDFPEQILSFSTES